MNNDDLIIAKDVTYKSLAKIDKELAELAALGSDSIEYARRKDLSDPNRVEMLLALMEQQQLLLEKLSKRVSEDVKKPFADLIKER